MAKVVERREMTAVEKIYLVEAARGLYITMKHFLRGFFHAEKLPTVSYPELKVAIPRDYRAQHRLMKRPDGSPRCVACSMCATACPSRCITVEAAPSADGEIEKRAGSFRIDTLRCVYCGLCVEACPVDAIRMDTEKVAFTGDAREKFVRTLDDLMDWDPKDYPGDEQSQKAPGGTLNEEARRTWEKGTGH